MRLLSKKVVKKNHQIQDQNFFGRRGEKKYDEIKIIVRSFNFINFH